MSINYQIWAVLATFILKDTGIRCNSLTNGHNISNYEHYNIKCSLKANILYVNVI